MKGIIVTLSLLCFGLTYGFSRYRRQIPNGYGVNHPCRGKGHWSAVGHMSGGYTRQKNVFGQDFSRAGARWTRELCMKDSDGDGLTNGEELGDPQCTWRPGDQASETPKGHPGFCEEDRQKCDSGMTHDECPNPRARGRGRGRGQGRGRTPARRPPLGANDHPQTTLSKNIDQRGGVGQSPPGFGSVGIERGLSLGQTPGFPSSPGSFSMGSGGFDRSLGDQTRRRPVEFGSFSSPSSGPQTRPGFSSSGTGSFGAPSLSQDFGVSDERYMGRLASGRPSETSSIAGRGDFFMPGRDRFSSSLDQRSIQGMGSPGLGPSFQSSLSQRDIERSVQARMDRERSRAGGSGGMRPSMESGSMGFGRMSSSSMRSGGTDTGPFEGAGMGSVAVGGMGSMRGGAGSMGGGMDPVGPSGMGSRGISMEPGIMGSMRSGGVSPMGPSGMGPMGSGGMSSGFSSGMEGYPPFMTMDSPGFGRSPFSSGARPGSSFAAGRMFVPGIPGPRF
ncbi:spidroin-1-like [Mercenaria mercenaria]|uniref:spidroin-1-like n=1 Tax=Mercenaria mercenaria TaxID=6596 RepID=UPI00234F52DA|nr:spidroin-1-like [Mercenaria mercenaria]